MPPARDTAVAVAQDRQYYTTDLSRVMRFTSFSAMLDGHRVESAIHIDLGLITLDGKVLDPVYFVLLGLNEECRKLQRGCFYYLPLRQNFSFNHACDMVFVDDHWDEFGCQKWDRSSWKDRLALCEAVEVLKPGEEVIPVNARILMRDLDLEDHTFCLTCSLDSSKVDKAHCPMALERGTEQTWMRFMMSHAGVDPAVTVGNSHYSCTTGDMSTFLIHYNNLGSPAFVCLSHAAEHPSLCKRYPTPRDVSETYVRETNLMKLTLQKDQVGRPSKGAKAAKLVMEGRASSNVDVVLGLLRAWVREDWSEYADRHTFGRLKYYWSEVVARMESGEKDWRDASKVSFWPQM